MRTASKIAQQTMALGLALAVALPPSAMAFAQETPKVALVPLVPLFGGAPQAMADKITELLARELRKQDGVELVPLLERAAPPAPGGAGKPNPNTEDDEGGGDSGGDAVPPFQGAGARPLLKGQAQIAKGKKDMQRLKFDAAVNELQEGIAGLEGSFDLLQEYGSLVDAYLQLAIAQLRLGQREAGEAALAAVIRLSPEHALTGSYPAVFTRLYGSLRQKLTQGTKGTLNATSTPAGQSVRIEGREVGVTPLTLELIPGTHFVVISGDAGKLSYKVQVQDGATVQIGNGDAEHRVVKVAAGGDTKVKSAADSSPLAKIIAEITNNNIDEKGAVALGKLSGTSGAGAVLFGGIHFLDDEQTTLALDCMLYSQSTQEVAALTRVQFDTDLTTARIELFKVATEVAQKLGHWSDVVGLPQPVAPGLKPPKTKVAGAHEARKTDEDLTPAPHTRKFEAQDGTDLGPGSESQVQKSSEGGGFPWLGVGIGVGAAAVVAVGAIVLVVVLTQKPGVTTQAGW